MLTNNGKLYLVATPIGNLSDITYRAVEVLKTVDLIAAEDTRNTKKLLNHYDIDKKLISYHEHNKYDKAKDIISKLKSGLNIALVTDAGTPLISDPGYELVSMLYDEGLEVESLPGACALVNALVLSGLDTREFVFVGFLSTDNKERRDKLLEFQNETKTMIFYISPHKFLKYIEEMSEIFGIDRVVSVCREMTKIHEEVFVDNFKNVINHFSSKEVKGEFVIVVKGKDEKELREEKEKYFSEIDVDVLFQNMLNEGKTEKESIKEIAKLRGVAKNEIYKLLKVKEV